MAVTIDVESGEVVVRMHGWDAVWALAREVRIPLGQVSDVQVRRRTGLGSPYLLRWGGTAWPGAVKAGRYVGRGRRELWCAFRAEWLLAIECAGADYDLVAVQTDDPHADALRIRDVLHRARV